MERFVLTYTFYTVIHYDCSLICRITTIKTYIADDATKMYCK